MRERKDESNKKKCSEEQGGSASQRPLQGHRTQLTAGEMVWKAMLCSPRLDPKKKRGSSAGTREKRVKKGG